MFIASLFLISKTWKQLFPSIDELNKNGKLKEGDVLLLSAFGAGFTSGAGLLKW